MALPTESPHSRGPSAHGLVPWGKPGPTLQRLSRRISGSRLSPGMRIFLEQYSSREECAPLRRGDSTESDVGITSLSTEVARQLCDPTLRQTYTGFLIMSSLHMPIVPDGQVTPGGAAAGTGVGDGAAAVVAGAGSSAVPDAAVLVFVPAG